MPNSHLVFWAVNTRVPLTQPRDACNPVIFQSSARPPARTSRGGQYHVRELGSSSNLGNPSVVALEGATKGHLLSHGGGGCGCRRSDEDGPG